MEVCVTTEFPFPARRVWAVLRDFGNQDYLSSLFYKVETQGRGIGMTRSLYRRGDDTPSIHRLDVLDDERMHLAYTVLQVRVVPTDQMRADLRLQAEGREHCSGVLTWTLSPPADFDEGELHAILLTFTEALAQQLNRYLASGGDRR